MIAAESGQAEKQVDQAEMSAEDPEAPRLDGMQASRAASTAVRISAVVKCHTV